MLNADSGNVIPRSTDLLKIMFTVAKNPSWVAGSLQATKEPGIAGLASSVTTVLGR